MSSLSAAGSRFPTTRGSAVLGTRSEDPAARQQAWQRVAVAYWKPVYKYIRLRWRKDRDTAEDLAQGFFADLLETEPLSNYDPRKGTFRTYLRTCLEAFLNNHARSARRLKRGGGFAFDSMDAERELSLQSADPTLSAEECFHREWQRNVFSLVVEDLRVLYEGGGKRIQFELFQRYDLAEQHPTYEDLASEFGLTSTTVTNYLAAARRDLRRCALERLREMTIDEREFRREAHALLGGGAR